MADLGATIQATQAPMFLLTGSAIFLNFLQARLFRVTDRLRKIAAGEATDDRGVHIRRGRVLRTAILLGVLAIALTLATAVQILFPLLLGSGAAESGALYTFAAAMGALVASAFLGLGDTIYSVAITEREARRDPGPGAPPRG